MKIFLKTVKYTCMLLPLAACLRQSPEDFNPERKNILGSWILDSVKVYRYDTLNAETPEANITDLADAFLVLDDAGTYNASSSTFVLYFLPQGNSSSSNYDTDVGKGLWQWYEKPTRRIHFDRGFAEFFSFAPLIYNVDVLTDTELEISIDDNKAIYDFGKSYGAALYTIILTKNVSNDTVGGKAFGLLIAQYSGLTDGLALAGNIYRPYFQGLAEALTEKYRNEGLPAFLSSEFKDAFDNELANGPGYNQGIAAAAEYPARYARNSFKLQYRFKRQE